MSLELTAANFDQFTTETSGLALVDFWAPWCGPCQMMGPIVEELSDEYDPMKVKVGKLNVDDNPTTAGNYQVLSIPTFLLFKNGQVADKVVGGVSKEKLKAMIEKNL